MTDRIDENPPMSIPEQAAEWLLRWHCGDLTIAERFEYLTWLKTSPVHIAETLRMCRLYSWLEATKLKLFVTNEDNFSNVVELPPLCERAAGRSCAGWPSQWKTSIAAGAATIVVGAIVALAVKVTWFDHTMRTEASEWRSVQLADGSSVNAAPYTRLHHDIGDDERLITLEQGSAVFRVAQDPARPFLVDTGVVVVKAIGTEFGVEHHDGAVTITVSEGSVAVLSGPDAAEAFASVSLEIDEQLTVSREGKSEFTQVNGDEYLQWGRGVLHFNSGNEVRHAVDRFNRSNETKIVVDEATGEMQIRGVFELNDPETFARAVQTASRGALVREGPERLRIQAREPNP
ncbi:MAG TPA: FecR domain-containing protein [Steroidobacteraceae bacterium]|nr:FecR domain-containing protein [Steroidobacteraceae bacterium]